MDVFKDNADAGTGADDYENRALVTTSSSPSGKWVTIREVNLADLDDVDADADSDAADMGENDGIVTTTRKPQSNVLLRLDHTGR